MRQQLICGIHLLPAADGKWGSLKSFRQVVAFGLEGQDILSKGAGGSCACRHPFTKRYCGWIISDGDHPTSQADWSPPWKPVEIWPHALLYRHWSCFPSERIVLTPHIRRVVSTAEMLQTREIRLWVVQRPGVAIFLVGVHLGHWMKNSQLLGGMTRSAQGDGGVASLGIW